MDIINNFSFWRNVSNHKEMKNKKIYLLALTITFLIFLILFIGLNKKNLYSNENINIENIPNFITTELFTKKEIDFNNITKQKKFTILNIWASWCSPCRIEHKFLSELSSYNHAELIGLNYKDKTENAKAFILELGNPYDIILIDPKGLISIEFGAYGVPETYIINNKNKKIIKKYIGPINNNTIIEIKSILTS